MNGNQEIELKLGVGDADCEAIVEDPRLTPWVVPGSRQSEIFEAIYYDTDSGDLSREGLVYRVRLEGERWVSTVKADAAGEGGLSRRSEWNVPVESEEPDLSSFADTEIEERLQKALAGKKLVPLFRTCFQRQSLLLVLPDSTRLELAADRGDIIAGEFREPIAEIELELKEGDARELLRLGIILAERHPLLPELRSKFERGWRLAGQGFGEKKKKPKAKPLSAGKVQAVLPRLFLQKIYALLEAQQLIACQPDCGEELERFRKKWRRLASLLALCRPVIGEGKYEKIQEILGELGREFSAWYRAKVCLNAWEELAANQIAPLPQEASYREMLTGEREEHYDRLRSLFAQGKATPVLLTLWVEFVDVMDGFRTTLVPEAGMEASAAFPDNAYAKLSMSEFIPQMLRNLLRDMLRAGKKPNFSDLAQVQDLLVKSVILRDNLREFEPILNESGVLSEAVKELRENLRRLLDGIENIGAVDELIIKRSRRILCHENGVFNGWEAYRTVMAGKELARTWRRFHRAAQSRL